MGLRKKLFEINMFSDLKIAPDLGQLPRSEEFFFNNYILPQTWGKSPVLGEIQLSKVPTHKRIILGKSKSTNLVKSQVPGLKTNDDLTDVRTKTRFLST